MKKYRHKHLRNKIKSLKPKKSIFRRRGFWVLALLASLLGLAFYLIFFFLPLQIQVIQISGNEKVATGDLQNSAWKNLGFKNIFMVDTNNVKKQLLTGFPNIEDVKIQKQWFTALQVNIIERKPVAIFCPNQTNQDCFLIDRNGVTYESAKATDDNFIIHGQASPDKNVVTAITKIQSDLQNNFQISLKEALASNPLVITTTEKWQIYFDPSADVDLEIAKLNALLKDQISATARKKLQYIYLQFKDRAYYK